MPQATSESEQGAKPTEVHGFICAIVSVVAFCESDSHVPDRTGRNFVCRHCDEKSGCKAMSFEHT